MKQITINFCNEELTEKSKTKIGETFPIGKIVVCVDASARKKLFCGALTKRDCLTR